uniref:Uncharacterized protein n=1 Tax=Arundo donax TaxID=35708 RepID=A0A0A9HGF4_ARUDO
MDHLTGSKQSSLQSTANSIGSDHCLKAPPPNLDRKPTSDPIRDDHRSSDPEPDLAATMMLGGSGRFSLARAHRQWSPVLPSIAEGSVVC